MQRLSRPAHSGGRLAALAVAAMVAGVVAVPQARAALDASSEWSARAGADAMAIEYLNTAAPVFAAEPIIYGTPATARSFVDSLDQSNAIAAAPYPGDVMVGMPDNGNGVLKVAGLPGALPTYPFVVTSEYPLRQHQVQDQSGNRLEANSSKYASSSDARSGVITGDVLASMQAKASSSVSVDEVTGELTALADSSLDAFRFTDALQFGRSTAHAKVVRAPGKDIVKESSFTLGSMIVNGVEMSYGDEGFKFADTKSPPPGDPKPLFDALKNAGITVEILPAKTTDTSVESAGMKITQVQNYGSYQQRISFIIGRVNAGVTGEAKPAAGLLFPSLPVSERASAPVTSDAQPAAAQVSLPAVSAGDVPLSGVSVPAYRTPSRLPDLSIPAAVSGVPVTPAVVEAITPEVKQEVAAPRPDVRLIQPASVGRSLRDDDYAGLLGIGGIVALLAVGVFLVAGRGGAAATTSVLKLPGA